MDVRLIDVPYDSGRRAERLGRGPLHLLEGGAADRAGRAGGGQVTRVTIESDADFPIEVATGFEPAEKLAAAVADARSGGRFPLVLAGNCMASVGTLSGLAEVRRLGVVWLDAHGDLNTPETTPTGFVDGMALAVLTGRCWRGLATQVPGYRTLPDERVLHLGGRGLDPAEQALLGDRGIAGVDGARFAREGTDALAAPLDALARHVDAVYLHLDLDVHDADAVRFNPYAEPGGPSPAQVREAVAAIGARVPIAAGALTAYAPGLDPEVDEAAIALDLLAQLVATVAG